MFLCKKYSWLWFEETSLLQKEKESLMKRCMSVYGIDLLQKNIIYDTKQWKFMYV